MFASTPMSRALLRALPLRWWAALSLGAAAIHFAVIADHVAEWWAFGLFFAALGWFQAIWPVAYVDRPSTRLAWTAILVNLATVALWAWSRTVGLPVGPEPGMPEPVGVADVVATVLELALAAGLLATGALATAEPSGQPAVARDRPTATLFGIALWLLVAVASTAAIALSAA